MSKKTVLVVGGAGFIGSHVNQMLDEAGYATIVFDNLSRSSRQPQHCGQFFLGDTANPEDLKKVFSENAIDAVMHFAADIDVGASVADPSACYRNNVCNGLNLVQEMLRAGVKNLVFSSTAAVYGLPQSDRINEQHPRVPINPYGHSKLMLEQILADLHKSHGLNVSCLRYFNAAGGDPNGTVKFCQLKPSNLVPLLLGAIKTQSTLTINGDDYDTKDGTCVRDYIHVADLGQAHILAMEGLFGGKGYSVYNLGNGNGFTVKEVIDAAEAVTGQSLSTKVGPRRAGDPPVLIADSSLALKELGWKPQFADIETIVRHAWQAM